MLLADTSPIHSDPRICGGTLVFKNTRVFAQTLLDYINAGDTLEDFLEDFPTVPKQAATRFSNFDVFVTADNNLGSQQNLRHRQIAFIEIPSLDRRSILAIREKLKLAISKSVPSDYVQLQS